ncbi:MAG: hypothetical protein ACLP02_16810, partial [Rhodomicrobium sp.]
KRRAARAVLRSHDLAPDRDSCLAHAEAARFELILRESAAQLSAISRIFGECASEPFADRRELAGAARLLASDLDGFENLARIIDSCPVKGLWPHVQRLAERPVPSGGASALAPLTGAGIERRADLVSEVPVGRGCYARLCLASRARRASR